MTGVKKGITRADVEAAFAEAGSIRGAARLLGVCQKTARHHLRRSEQPVVASAAVSSRETFTVDQSEQSQTITSVSSTVRTLEDALRAANVDLLVWEVDRHTINKWDMARGTKDDRWDAVELWQVKVWLKRRKVSVFVDPLQSLIDGIRKIAPKAPSVKYKSSKDAHLLVVGLFDAHFGKLAWAAETGNDYDLKIAETVFANAFHDLISRISGYQIESIILPIGQDFFHTDNPQNATVNGTPQDVDGRRRCSMWVCGR
jgi:hypothetical protein